jgi:hypothetical protein
MPTVDNKAKAKNELRVQRLMGGHGWRESVAKAVVARTMTYEEADQDAEYRRQLKGYMARQRAENREHQGGSERDRLDFPLCFGPERA